MASRSDMDPILDIARRRGLVVMKTRVKHTVPDTRTGR